MSFTPVLPCEQQTVALIEFLSLITEIAEETRGRIMSLCKFCATADRRFTCPRCNADYCSLACYRSRDHQDCSEQFYKECVTEELRGQGRHACDV